MPALTVTATQGGSTAAGMGLRVMVLTGAKPAAQQTGGSAQQLSASGTFTQSITTSAGSNVYGGASSNGASGDTQTGSNATVVDHTFVGSVVWIVTFKALNVTGAATVRGYTTAASDGGPLAQLEILAAATLAEDASGPAFASANATTVATASFTPPAGSLLVAVVSSNGGAAQTTMTVSDSSGLQWSEKVKHNLAGDDYAGVWIADVPATLALAVPFTGGKTWRRRNRRRQILTVGTGAPLSLISVADAGAADDSGFAVTAAVSLAESGAGADTLAVTAAVPLAEAGTGTDALAAGVAISLAEAGTGTDTLAVTAAPALADAGSGAESLAVTATVPLADAGTGTDTAAVTAAVPLADAGTGADTLAIQAATNIAVAESGTGADTLALTAVTTANADTGIGTDTLVITVTLGLADTGSGADSLTFIIGAPPAVNAASAPLVTAGVTSAPAVTAVTGSATATTTPVTHAAATAATVTHAAAITDPATSAPAVSDG